MILKIRRELNKDNLGWCWIDHIREINANDWTNNWLSVRKEEDGPFEGDAIRIMFGERGKEKEAKEHQINCDKSFLQWDNLEDGGLVKVIEVEFTDGSSMRIATQTETYLLSDNGETVERLLGPGRRSAAK